jgi:hypothetical protein
MAEDRSTQVALSVQWNREAVFNIYTPNSNNKIPSSNITSLLVFLNNYRRAHERAINFPQSFERGKKSAEK